MHEGEVEEFGRVFQRFLDDVVHAVPRRSSGLAARLGEHLGADALEQPLTGATLSPLDHADLQRAIDAYVADGARSHVWVGLGVGARHHESVTDLLAHGGAVTGPVAHREVPTGVDTLSSCVTSGAALVEGPDDPPHAILLRMTGHGPRGPELALDVLSTSQEHGAAVLADLRERMRADSVYRGQVVSLQGSHDPFERATGVRFLPRPSVARDEVVLPTGVLRRIEQRTIGFSRVADRLAAEGHNRRRGVLLHGPPGTGKTLTVRYLIGQQPERTVVVLAGQALLGGIAPAAAIARRLQPATIVLEDVDLVARQREHGPVGNPVLFELLNELDGLGGDADVLVLLTTNRADLLEPALAARPGRVDLAVELPLPALTERRRLLDVAVRDVPAEDVDWDRVAERIAGTPASFVEELVRTAALRAALAADQWLTTAHVEDALQELLDSGPVTAALLGAAEESDGADPWH